MERDRKSLFSLYKIMKKLKRFIAYEFGIKRHVLSLQKMSISIESKITYIEASLSALGFTVGMPELWVPEFGWDPVKDEHAMEDPYLPQYLAAVQIMIYFFGPLMKSWCHIAAEMQAGKTGVICTLIRLMLISANYRLIKIKPDSIFVLTGMSDNAWKKQTMERIPHESIRFNVYHNGGLTRLREALMLKASREGGLKNLLMILDESHIAARYNNRPAKEIFDTLASLCPIEKWAENNIRFITISATDPAATVGVGSANEYAKIVRVLTSDDYQSVESLNNTDRLHQTFNLTDDSSVEKLLSFITTTYGENAKLYHILRPKARNGIIVEESIRKLWPTASVIRWDCSNSSSRSSVTHGSSTTSAQDINEILGLEPEVPTFIILKNMFYASKTLEDDNVGVLHDRPTGKADTNLQSLLGRGCGYKKSKTTHIFTEMQIVNEYISFWRDLPADEKIAVPAEIRKMMPHVVEVEGSLQIDQRRSLPISGSATGIASQASAIPKKTKTNPDDFVSIWSDWFRTEDEVMEWWRSHGGRARKLKSDADGFLVCSATGSPERLRMGVIEGFRGGKNTANMPSCNKMVSGQHQFRRYVAYENINNKKTARFCVHMITRK